MKFRPLHDGVVVRRLEQEEKTAGGIIIPDLPRRSRKKVKSSPSGPVPGTASFNRSSSRLVIAC
jgi:chaperonin GroES